ncbi:MAG TPA: hypothetical protein VL832_05385 [Puia sp.]|jgi:hypothetical protein|nr:hypothetical protein [Puia sp.]
MKRHVLSLVVTVVLLATFFSCKKSETIGGSHFTATVNMSTYDYLKTNHLFDTLVIMIDKMGLKDEVNNSGTFFAVTNFTMRNYVQARQTVEQVIRNDENLVYTFDSLDLSSLKDSLRSYMFPNHITRDSLTQLGRLYKANNGETRLIQLIPTTDYTNQNVFITDPEYVYLTKILPLPGSPVPTDSTGLTQLQPEQLLQTLCQTSGILTTTGVLHVLNNGHMFNYYNDQK